jgi:hypothetical protein
MLLFMSGYVTIEQDVTVPKLRRPSLRSRRYVSFRAGQLLLENERLKLPSLGGFVQSFVNLEAEADRESQRWGSRAGRYNGLYVLLGLPAAVLAAIAGVTVLASTAGRLAAGIVALMSAALSASATFLDSAKKRDGAAKFNTEWEDLYNEMRVCRLTELASFTTDSGSSRMASFAARAAAIRAGRDQATAKQGGAPGGGPPAKQLFQRVPNMRGMLLPKAELEMSELSLELDVEPNTDPSRARRLPGSPPPVEPEIVRQSVPPGTPVPEGTGVRVWVIPAGFVEQPAN